MYVLRVYINKLGNLKKKRKKEKEKGKYLTNVFMTTERCYLFC